MTFQEHLNPIKIFKRSVIFSKFRRLCKNSAIAGEGLPMIMERKKSIDITFIFQRNYNTSAFGA